jgi:hypothetical protein
MGWAVLGLWFGEHGFGRDNDEGDMVTACGGLGIVLEIHGRGLPDLEN